MAKLVGVFNTAHSPFCYMAPERWNEVRANRSLREDVPMDTLEQNQAKAARIKNGFAILKAKMAEVKPEHGIGHAILRPAESLTDMDVPIVPVLVNCYYAPQPTAARCYEFGKALRKAIEEAPQDLRVAVVGSGGLWHTPGAKSAYLDEDFDHEMLKHLEAGDIKGMAEHFDNYNIPEGDTSQYIGVRARQATGMPGFGGPQGGTRETCNWIIAAAVADGTKNVIVDYVPVYASPIGAAWAYTTGL